MEERKYYKNGLPVPTKEEWHRGYSANSLANSILIHKILARAIFAGILIIIFTYLRK